MNLEDEVLGLLKEKPLLMSKLQEQWQLSTVELVGVLAFLQKYKLVEIIPLDSPDGGEMVWITPRGLQLLNLPNLPENEPPSNLLGLMEKHYGGKNSADLKPLYTPTQHTETADWITDMAIRYGVKANDVIRALWLDGKTTVWAKLEQDKKEKGRRKEK